MGISSARSRGGGKRAAGRAATTPAMRESRGHMGPTIAKAPTTSGAERSAAPGGSPGAASRRDAGPGASAERAVRRP